MPATLIRTCRRFARLNAADRALVVQAFGLLLGVRVALRVMPFAALHRALARWSIGARQPVDRVSWAVQAAARRVPGTRCLAEALVMHAMLRHHGHAPVFRLGVREHRSAIEAHAWVECDGVVVIGAVEHLADHAVLS